MTRATVFLILFQCIRKSTEQKGISEKKENLWPNTSNVGRATFGRKWVDPANPHFLLVSAILQNSGISETLFLAGFRGETGC
eukprot:4721641-Amphidinium_carterae.1